MKISFECGDLIQMTKEYDFDIVAHGANCFHTMGSGIAPKLNEFTKGMLLKVDKRTPYGDINKLGTISFVELTCGPIVYLMVANIYSQFSYGKSDRGEVYVHWDSVQSGLDKVIQYSIHGDRIGIPYIGCGLAGGDEANLISILNNLKHKYYDKEVELVLVKYDGVIS